ncbi:hypothetical protein O8I67_02050 [Streptococcus uberis]|uniref:hypothetical protein n=1 Tax=Streptococcus uberis TaxID=1349 RepID=UPI0022B8A6CA|nr:hypothetical protein [Streptococcus uberis]MCZ8465838.1 hypothetical protein [Streptococcus uberis]
MDKYSFELVMYFLGIAPSLSVLIYKTLTYKYKIWSFRKLIYSSYISNLYNYFIEYDIDYLNKIKKEISENIYKLDYLKKEELLFLPDNFEYIRIVSFTLSTLSRIDKILNNYSYHSLDINGSKIDKDFVKNKEEIVHILENFEKNLVKYSKLKIDKY